MPFHSVRNLLKAFVALGRSPASTTARLLGISAYRELEREFAIADRLSFTAPDRELSVANRDLGTIERGRDREEYKELLKQLLAAVRLRPLILKTAGMPCVTIRSSVSHSSGF